MPAVTATLASLSAARTRRTVWHCLAALAAALITGLVLLGYAQPGLVLDLAAFRLC